MKQTVQKQAVPVVIDSNNEPVAIVYFTQSRERVIYMLQKADEEEIVQLLAGKTYDDGEKQARDTANQ